MYMYMYLLNCIKKAKQRPWGMATTPIYHINEKDMAH